MCNNANSQIIEQIKNDLKDYKEIHNNTYSELKKETTNEKNIQEIISKKTYPEQIRKVNANISEINNIIFYHNLKNLTFKTYRLQHFNYLTKNNIAATYNPIENKIYLTKNWIDTDLYHELFHVGSTITFKELNIIASGFQYKNKTNGYLIGTGINEGYTQHLVNKNFGYDRRKSYLLESIIADKLEKIIDPEELKKLYLTADLHRLIEELNNYNTIDNIINFILEVDYVQNLIKLSKSKDDIPAIQESLLNIYYFLGTTYYNKLNSIPIMPTNIKNNEMKNFMNSLNKVTYPYSSEYIETSLHFIKNDEIGELLNQIINQNKQKSISIF